MGNSKSEKVVSSIFNDIINKSQIMDAYNLGMAQGLFHLYKHVKETEGVTNAQNHFYSALENCDEGYVTYLFKLIDADYEENGNVDSLCEHFSNCMRRKY